MKTNRFKKLLEIRELKEDIAAIRVVRKNSEIEQKKHQEVAALEQAKQHAQRYRESNSEFGHFSDGACSIDDLTSMLKSADDLKGRMDNAYDAVESIKRQARKLKNQLEVENYRLREMRSKKVNLERQVKQISLQVLNEEIAREEDEMEESATIRKLTTVPPR